MNIYGHDAFAMLRRSFGKDDGLVFVDVGANVGDTCRRMKTEFPNATVYAFEPVPDVVETLRTAAAGMSDVHVIAAAVGSSEGPAQMVVTRNRWCSSVLEPDGRALEYYDDWCEAEARVGVPMVTLDAWARREGVKKVDVLKVDVQGLELEVLRGAEGLLRSGVGAVICETQLIEEYQGAATLSAIEPFMRACGFVLHQVHAIHHNGVEEQASFADVLFLRKDLLERLRTMPLQELDVGWTQRMRDGLAECARNGWKRVAVYGAGRHTQTVAAEFDGAPVEVVAIVDDDAHRQGQMIGGRRIVSPAAALKAGVDAVVLSSNYYEDQLWEKAAVFREAGVPVVRLYGDALREAKPSGDGASATKAGATATNAAGHFRVPHYLRLNQRRLEHLASLGLPLAGKRVLELGCGVGDLTAFWVDRGCRVHCVDGREENLAVLRAEWAGRSEVTSEVRNMDETGEFNAAGGKFDVVFCYGLLYHLEHPTKMLDFASAACGPNGVLLLETCVSFGEGTLVNPVAEDAAAGSQAVGGLGCRPTRGWVMGQLRERFEHVYVPRTQPAHEEFPRDWSGKGTPGRLSRGVFVAGRSKIESPVLANELLMKQTI